MIGISCGTNNLNSVNEETEVEQDITCTCLYQKALLEQGYKSNVKSVKHVEFDLDGENHKFSNGRIENYDKFGRIPFYHMLLNENDLGDKVTFVYDENGCVKSSFINSLSLGDTVTMMKNDYLSPSNVRVSFCGNLQKRQFTSTIDQYYNEKYQLVKSIEHSIYFKGGRRERMYSYDENGNLITRKTYEYGDTGVKEYPADSTIAEFVDGRIMSETTYGNGKIVLSETYQYILEDERGNWTEMKHKMTWTDLEAVYLTRRTIEYY
jgi:hypothetical protein